LTSPIFIKSILKFPKK